jgi:hypothetical protein
MYSIEKASNGKFYVTNHRGEFLLDPDTEEEASFATAEEALAVIRRLP